jgi:hypothetical protein
MTGWPAGLRIDAETLLRNNATPQQLIHDLDALLVTAEARRGDFLAAIEQTSQRVAAGQLGQLDSRIDSTVQSLGREITDLQGMLREETYRQELLVADLNRARLERDTVLTKVQEAEIAATTNAAAKVEIVGRANSASKVYPVSPDRAAVLAAAVGLMLGLIVVVAIRVVEMRTAPDDSPRTHRVPVTARD